MSLNYIELDICFSKLKKSSVIEINKFLSFIEKTK